MQGYVAFLDVLGFTALVSRDEDGTKLTEFGDCLKEATEPLEVDFILFSDSIVLTAKSDTDAAFAQILESCSQLFARLLDLNIAVRGAISFGSYERRLIGSNAKQESAFVAGNALIDAYQFEQAQDWVGIMVAPAARERLPDLPDRCAIMNAPSKPWAPYVQPCSVPFHSDRRFEGFAIVPNLDHSTADAIVTDLTGTIRTLDWLRSIAPTPEAQGKYLRTMQWLERLKQLWFNVATSEQTSLSMGHIKELRRR